MARAGSNLPGFRETQLDFAAHIRSPEAHARPADVEPRRMKIYVQLFYNNIEGFLASAFPIAKQVLGDDRWHRLVREFVHRHGSTAPYFLQISQEFLTFLADRAPDDDPLPEFLLELAHYEWVELALGVSELEIPDIGYDPQGEIYDSYLVISPLAWCLAYEWPVHQIGPEHRPIERPANPTELIACRRRDDTVSFMEVNAATLSLVQRLQDGATVRQALEGIASEMPEADSKVVYERGIATLERLRHAQIVLGCRVDG